MSHRRQPGSYWLLPMVQLCNISLQHSAAPEYLRANSLSVARKQTLFRTDAISAVAVALLCRPSSGSIIGSRAD